MADEPIDVEPEQIIAEAQKEENPKTIDIDDMGANDLVQKEIELTRNKGKYGRYGYNEAKELAAIQRRLYGSPKVNLPKKPMTPFEYSKNMERYAPIMPRTRSRTYGMEVLGKTNMEYAKQFDRNKLRQHRLRSKLRNVFEETEKQSPMLKSQKKRKRKKSKKDKDKDGEKDKKR